MNKITATGRVVADAELRTTPSGDAICSFRVASDVGFGERKTTNWFNCTVWGRRGESLVNILKKGTAVTIFGTLTLREWTNKEGVRQISPDIRLDEVSLHGNRDSSSQYTPQTAPRSQTSPAAMSDDDDLDSIPF